MPNAIISPAMLHDGDILLTFKEAMERLHVSRSTMYRLMWTGQLTGHKIGSTWRFYKNDLQEAIRAVSYAPIKQPA